MSEKQKLFICKLQPYDALKLNCETRWNLGALEKSFLGGGYPGTLNAKIGLIDLIRTAGGDFAAEPGFVPARNGMLRRGAGTSYIGWKDFLNRAAAIKYLEQYFDLSECSEDDPPVGSISKMKPPKNRVDPKGRSDSISATIATVSSSVHGRSKSDLERLGFLNLGQWESQRPTRLKDIGDDAECWKELIQKERALYAFCHGEEVLYIGKTARSVTKRFVGYRSPGKRQTTNQKCHDRIQKLLGKNKTVRILVFPDTSKLQWDDFRINLAAGLEDALVAHFKPVLNGGNSGKLITATAEDEQRAEG